MAKAFVENDRQIAAAAQYDARKLARLRQVSPRQLQREFQRIHRRTPQAWLNEQRILAARQLLLAGHPVKNVAQDLGYKQSSHFCRQFKQYNLMTPSEFAQLNTNAVADR